MITSSAMTLLELQKILALASGFAHSDATVREVMDLRPFEDREKLGQRFLEVGEVLRLYTEGEQLRLSVFSDISSLLQRVRPEGALLEPLELSRIMQLLSVATDLSGQLDEREDLLVLKGILQGLTGHPLLLKILKKSIDTEGNILDSASYRLSEIREQVRRLESRIRKKLEEMVRDEKTAVFLQDDFITSRSGRWVIPVRMDSKGQVPGVVHDVSKSGETAFVEPLHIIGLSNEHENLIAEQKAEEIRILRSISSAIREAADSILQEYGIIVHLDLLHCIARLSGMFAMQIPEISGSMRIRLCSARHPLLLHARIVRGNAKEVVPLDLALGDDATVMVITGSNAGGKTIAIKTVGLLLVMALSGMPVPADSSSVFPFVNALLVDIGDEQSIEANLSTFSAHVSHISEILKASDNRTVVLVDELGTGTDPDEGAALACAVLGGMRQTGALVFATTHLTDIKGFVHRTDGMMNASMEFDHATLTPLYKLRAGEPGQSHALEVALKYGMPHEIVQAARAFLGGNRVELDNLISDLNQKRLMYEQGCERLEKEKAENNAEQTRLKQLKKEIELLRKETLADAYQSAAEIIAETKRTMHAHIEELKREGLEARKKAIREVENLQKAVQEKVRELLPEDTEAVSAEMLRQGDEVYIQSLGYDAVVTDLQVKHDRLRVSAGGKEFEIPLSDVRIRKGRAPIKARGEIRVVSAEERTESVLDIRGQRVDEALSMLEKFLNHAMLSSVQSLLIIHGIGKGILHRAVHEHLAGHPLVKEFRQGVPHEGGSGVTVVSMK